MSIDFALVIGAFIFIFCGIYLILDKAITKIILGFLWISGGVNFILLAAGGKLGISPIFRSDARPEDYSDPLPQAFILTSIVITFATAAFLLAFLYRSWCIAREDTVREVADDTVAVDVVAEEVEDAESEYAQIEKDAADRSSHS